jgi:hypothetical protein
MPDEDRARSNKKALPPSNTAYHRPLSCPPSPSWWNILATGALRSFFRRGDIITPVAELSRQGFSVRPDVRASAESSSPPRNIWGGCSWPNRFRKRQSFHVDNRIDLVEGSRWPGAETITPLRRAHQGEEKALAGRVRRQV